MVTKLEFPVYEFRPIDLKPEHIHELYRWDDIERRLIPDDGEYGIAFAKHPIIYEVFMPYYTGKGWSWCLHGRWDTNVRDIYPEHPNGNAWHHEYFDQKINWNKRDEHPNVRVWDEIISYLESIDQGWGAYNGYGCEMYHIHDPYIDRGLIRRKDTKEIVVYPRYIDCMYCGRLDWRVEEEEADK